MNFCEGIGLGSKNVLDPDPANHQFFHFSITESYVNSDFRPI